MNKKKKWKNFWLRIPVTLIWIIAMVALFILRMVYDYNEPMEYSVRVIDKEFISGKSGGYYVTVSPWDDQMENVQFGISSNEYDSVRIGERLTVVQSEGALKMKWYYLKLE